MSINYQTIEIILINEFR